MNKIDLHVHSTFSDGTCTPAELLSLAEQAGLSYMALTDHDTVAGIPIIQEAARLSSVRIIPGVELSSANKKGKKQDIHILGLNIDINSQKFAEHLQKFQDDRLQRNRKMCEKLTAAGYDISIDALIEAYPDAILTRCHVARFLADKGYTTDIKEAFDTLIGSGCPFYVPRFKITPAQAVTLIKQAGGCAILAHPLLYELTHEELCELIEQLKQYELDGIEAIYSCNKDRDEAYVRSLAERYDLAISGGSDFHGSNKPDIHLGTGRGNLSIPEELLSGLLGRDYKNFSF